MEITGATFHFTKKVVGEEESPQPENPEPTGEEKPKPDVASNRKEEGKGGGGEKLGHFAYDMFKQSLKTGISAVTSSISDSPTLQIQIQAMQQVGAKVAAYTTAIASQNYLALAAMAVSDTVSYGIGQMKYAQGAAWSEYELEQYRERRGYSASRTRK